MRQYTTLEQTAKLIELGFKKPRFDAGVTKWEGYEPICTGSYTLGELLSFLPPIIPQGNGYYINITHDSVSWVIDYHQHGDTQYKYIVSDIELIDALFAMIIKLKEKGEI